MDYLSALLGFISILQNIKKKKSLEEKVSVISDAMERVFELESLLSITKKVHDGFDSILSSALDPLMASLSDDTKSKAEIKNHMESFLRQARKLPKIDVPSELSEFDQEKTRNLPTPDIAQAIVEVYQRFPTFRKHLSSYYQHLNNIEESHENEDYGKGCYRSVSLAHNAVRGCMNDADRLILCSSVIMAFIHYEIRRALKEIV